MDTHEEIKKSAHYIENAQQHAQPNVDAETAPYMEVVDPEHTDHIQRINEIIETEHPGESSAPESISNTPPAESYTPRPESERQLDQTAIPQSAEEGTAPLQTPGFQTEANPTHQRSVLKGVVDNVLMPVKTVANSVWGALKSYSRKPFGSSSSADFNGRTTVPDIAKIVPLNKLSAIEQDIDPQKVVQFPAQSQPSVVQVPENVTQFPTQPKEVQHAA